MTRLWLIAFCVVELLACGGRRRVASDGPTVTKPNVEPPHQVVPRD